MMKMETVQVREDLMEKSFEFGKNAFQTKGDLLNKLLEGYILRQGRMKEILELQGILEDEPTVIREFK